MTIRPPLYRLCERLLTSVDAEDHRQTRAHVAAIRKMLAEPYSSWCGIEMLGAYERGLEEGRKQ